MYANTNPRRQAQRLLVGENNKLRYTAPNYGGDTSHRHQLSQFLVGVYDREAGTLRMVGDAAAAAFQLKQIVKGVDDAVDDDDAERIFEGSDDREVKNALTNSFGSKKSQRKLAALKMNAADSVAISGGSEVSRQLAAHPAAKEVGATERAEEQSRRDKYPPFDLAAKFPEGAYIFNKMVSEQEKGTCATVLTQRVKALLVLAKDSRQSLGFAPPSGEAQHYPKHLLNFLRSFHSLSGVQLMKKYERLGEDTKTIHRELLKRVLFLR
jgi:hypothetical protein